MAKGEVQWLGGPCWVAGARAFPLSWNMGEGRRAQGLGVPSVIPTCAGKHRTGESIQTRFSAFGASSLPRKLAMGRGTPTRNCALGAPARPHITAPHHPSPSPPSPLRWGAQTRFPPPRERPLALPSQGQACPPRKRRSKQGPRLGSRHTSSSGSGYAVTRFPVPVRADAALVRHLRTRSIVLVVLRCEPLIATRSMVLTPCCYALLSQCRPAALPRWRLYATQADP